MGVIESQIDRYADEQGELDRKDERVKRAWESVREDMADQLISGKPLEASCGTVLSFGDITDRLWSLYPSRGEAALRLCVGSHELGGKHTHNLLYDIALELVDNFADAFKKDLEQ
jgi:hypothetical protein